MAVTRRRLPSWADKFGPDGPVVLSLGDGTGPDSIPLNRVTFCNALLLDLLISNSKVSAGDKDRSPDARPLPTIDAC